MSNNIFDDAWAAGVVDSNAAGNTKTRGCKVAVDGNFVYTFTLDRELDEYDCTTHVSIRGNSGVAAKSHMVSHVSDSVKEIRFFYGSAGTPQATDFSIAFRRIANGQQ